MNWKKKGRKKKKRQCGFLRNFRRRFRCWFHHRNRGRCPGATPHRFHTNFCPRDRTLVLRRWVSHFFQLIRTKSNWNTCHAISPISFFFWRFFVYFITLWLIDTIKLNEKINEIDERINKKKKRKLITIRINRSITVILIDKTIRYFALFLYRWIGCLQILLSFKKDIQ